MDVAAKEWNMRAARAIIRQHRYVLFSIHHVIIDFDSTRIVSLTLQNQAK